MDNLKDYLQQHKDELDIDNPSGGLWDNIKQQTAAKPTGGKVFKTMLRYAVAACLLCVFVLGIKWLANEKTNAVKPIAQRQEDREAGIQDDRETRKQEGKEASGPERREGGKVGTQVNKEARRQEYKRQENSRQNMAVLKAELPTRLKISPEEHAANELVANLETGYAKLVNMQLQKVRATPVLAEGPNYFNEFKIQLKQMDVDEANIRHDIKKNGLNDALLEQLINVYQQKLNVLKNLQTEINKMNNQVKENKPNTDPTHSFFLNI